MSAEKLISAKNLSKKYKRGRSEVVHALDDVSLDIHPAEMILLYGPSGSGKSTLLQLLSGLDTPTQGSIEFKGQNITEWKESQLTKYRRENIGFVFQSWELIDHLNAVENVESPLYPMKVDSRELRTRAIQLLRKMELLDREDHFPKELSGGEQQRVAVARALIKEPAIIFADEPTGNLDSETGDMIMRMLKTVCRQGTAMVIATHNEELRKYADRIIKLHDGKKI
jgi:putative ABC transport system ATP-binding protein